MIDASAVATGIVVVCYSNKGCLGFFFYYYYYYKCT